MSTRRQRLQTIAAIAIACLLFGFNARAEEIQTGNPTRYFENQTIRIETPEPRINLPGLHFTAEEKILREIETDKETPGKITRYLNIPYLPEYISAVYKYAVAIASILAVVMIIVSGFMWTASGGNTDTITKARTRIVGAVTGLIIALGSYTLLYSINPELVQFRALRIPLVEPDYDVFTKSDHLDSEVRAETSGACPSGQYTACHIAKTGAVASAKMVDRVKKLGGQGAAGPVLPCPLDKFTPESPPLAATAGNLPLDDKTYDKLFDKYGSCVGILDGNIILKAMSYTESGHNASAINKQGFIGLFQTKQNHCQFHLQKYNLQGYCNDLFNPETNTMVAAAMARRSMEIIRSNCGDASPDKLVYFLYTGLHGGHGTLKKALKETACDETKACRAIYNFWAKKSSYSDSNPPDCAKQ